MWSKVAAWLGAAFWGSLWGFYIMGHGLGSHDEISPGVTIMSWGLCAVAGFFWGSTLDGRSQYDEDTEPFPINVLMVSFFAVGFITFYHASTTT